MTHSFYKDYRIMVETRQTESVQAQRDAMAAQFMAAQQQIVELRHWVVMLLQGGLGAEELEKIRILLERTAR